jgi:hypothetical protein
MRRPYNKDKPTDVHSTGDIKKDFTPKQLAAFGAACLAYNVLEDQIDALLYVVTNVPEWLIREVTTRIHGLDGKTAIIQTAIENSSLSTNNQKGAIDSIATFSYFKKIRDAMIHARIINATIGIGLSNRTRGEKAFEVLLTLEALETFYDHVVALNKELSGLGSWLASTTVLKTSAPNDPNKSRYVEACQVHETQFQEHRRRRRSLKPLPQFPDEAQLRTAVARWSQTNSAAVAEGWMQQWTEPLMRPRRTSNAVLEPGSHWVPRPPPDEKK